MHLVMSGLGVLILAAICGLSGFFVIAELRRGHRAEAIAKAPPVVPDVSSRLLDPKPLSLEEVFPNPEIRLVVGAAPYTVDMTHIDTDCAIATTGRTAELLDDRSCSQVVRASITAPYGGYHVTAGVFNLADAAGAAEAGQRLGDLLESGRGSFAAMADGGPGSDPLTQPLSQVGWREQGHFLIYCVISRPDGQVVRNNDPYAPQITTDLVESYLGSQILGARSLGA
jgi:hypothetical protein